jgi:DNA polymerase III subunit epsilon
MTQTHLFSDDIPAAPAPTKSRKRAAAAPNPHAMEPETLARTLEQHPDYRVLRRLVPSHDYGPAPGHDRVQRILVLDTETTGLSHRSDKIIELALLLVQVDADTGLPFGPVEIYEGFEDPGVPIPEAAKAVTGISDEMVQGQRLDDARVLALAQRADLVVAHNAGFDRPFMEARFSVFADKAWACSFKDIDWNAAGAGSAKLGALAQDQGWFYDAHRAQVDCHALLQVLTRPVSPGPQTGIARLLAAAAQPSYQLNATAAPFEAKDLLKARAYRWDAEARVWGCSLATPELLDAECDWLRENVYGRRAARLDIAALNSRVRYSLRPGGRSQRAL